MKCEWDAYVAILPLWLREKLKRISMDNLLEIRMRIDIPLELVTADGSIWLDRKPTVEDLKYTINMASKYSPWSSVTIGQGYLTAAGGHRIGVCGIPVIQEGKNTGFRQIHSLNIRVSRDFPGISVGIPYESRSVLIIGIPGSGKTTLLRDLIRRISNHEKEPICVVDEKGEIFPTVDGRMCFETGKRTDVMTGCGKYDGIYSVLRNMTPSVIAVDEITEERDCEALIHAGWCGVKLLATAHAGSRTDLFSRPVYKQLIDKRIFDTLIVLNKDKNWHQETMYNGN